MSTTPRTDALAIPGMNCGSVLALARQLETELNAKNAAGSPHVSDALMEVCEVADAVGFAIGVLRGTTHNLAAEIPGHCRTLLLEAADKLEPITAKFLRKTPDAPPAAVTDEAELTEPREGATLRPITPEDITAAANRSYDLGRKHGIGECQDELEDLRLKVSSLLASATELMELREKAQELGAIDAALGVEFQVHLGDKRSGDLLDDFQCFFEHHKELEAHKKELRELNSKLISDLQSAQAANQKLVEALEKIIEMNRQHAEDKYGNADKAESWACVIVGRSALTKESP